jgi:hypothetical protein
MNVWTVLFKKSEPAPKDEAAPVALNCILHFLARRDEADEGFIVTTKALSTRSFVYQTRARLRVGETLRIKVVSGSYSIDVGCRVASVPDGLQPTVEPTIEFVGLDDMQRRILSNLIQRYRKKLPAS